MLLAAYAILRRASLQTEDGEILLTVLVPSSLQVDVGVLVNSEKSSMTANPQPHSLSTTDVPFSIDQIQDAIDAAVQIRTPEG